MSLVSRNTVKTWFETGDRPTQAQFYDWLDSVVWYDEVNTTLPYKKVDSDNYVILPSDYVLSVNNGGNSWTINLPNAIGVAGKVYIIKRYRDNAAGGIIITTLFGTSIIQGANGSIGASITLSAWGTYADRMMFMSNGEFWEYIK